MKRFEFVVCTYGKEIKGSRIYVYAKEYKTAWIKAINVAYDITGGNFDSIEFITLVEM